jgi:hypothetical protein
MSSWQGQRLIIYKLVQAVIFLTCLQGVCGSNLSQDTAYVKIL